MACPEPQPFAAPIPFNPSKEEELRSSVCSKVPTALTTAAPFLSSPQALGRTPNGLPLDPLCSAGRSSAGGHQYSVGGIHTGWVASKQVQGLTQLMKVI